MQSIGNRIKILRLGLKLKQDDFAEKAGITGSCLGRYENGIRRVPVDIIEQIAEAFEVSPAWLAGWEDSPRTGDAVDMEYIREQFISAAKNAQTDTERVAYLKGYKIIKDAVVEHC